MCDMRFHVPNNELDKYHDDLVKQMEADGKVVADDEDVLGDMTAAKLFNERILERASIN